MASSFDVLVEGLVQGNNWDLTGEPDKVRDLLEQVVDERAHRSDRSTYQVRVNLQRGPDAASFAGFTPARTHRVRRPAHAVEHALRVGHAQHRRPLDRPHGPRYPSPLRFVELWPQLSVVRKQGDPTATSVFEDVLRTFAEFTDDDGLRLTPGHAYFLDPRPDLGENGRSTRIVRRLRLEVVPLLRDYVQERLLGPATAEVAGLADRIESLSPDQA